LGALHYAAGQYQQVRRHVVVVVVVVVVVEEEEGVCEDLSV